MINKFEGEYFFLSNFYPSPIVIKDGEDEFIAKTVEHYFQYMKTPSMEEGIGILAANTPGEAKRLGRKCHLHKDWEQIKDEVMLTALRKKFTIPELKKKLIATGDKELIEGNLWHDCFWGVCHCNKCNHRGKNHLGKLLMQVREELKNK